MVDSPSAKRLRCSNDAEMQRQAMMAEEDAIYDDPETPGDTQSSLEKLPRELVWQLLEHAPESVFSLRMTSAMLRRRVDEYTSQRIIMPLVEKLSFSESELLKTTAKAIVSVPTVKSRIFELRFKSLNSQRFPFPMKITHSFGGRSWAHYKFRVTEEHQEMIDFFEELIGREIKKVELIKFRDKKLEMQFKIINGIDIGHLIYFPYSLNDATLTFLKTISANHLSLTAGVIETSCDWKNILLELSSLFQSLCIDQSRPLNYAVSRGAYFGIRGFDWASVILEMFARKVNKLHIVNNIDPAYLSKISADKLTEHLPLIGKKVWFTTICTAYAEPITLKNSKHWITYENGFLSIKHRSRRHEFSSFY